MYPSEKINKKRQGQAANFSPAIESVILKNNFKKTYKCIIFFLITINLIL